MEFKIGDRIKINRYMECARAVGGGPKRVLKSGTVEHVRVEKRALVLRDKTWFGKRDDDFQDGIPMWTCEEQYASSKVGDVVKILYEYYDREPIYNIVKILDVKEFIEVLIRFDNLPEGEPVSVWFNNHPRTEPYMHDLNAVELDREWKKV